MDPTQRTTPAHPFGPADDGLHPTGENFYQTETFWYSFVVPERRMGAWLYTSVRPNAGVTAGGLWIWDDTSPYPVEVPFYEYFAHLKPPRPPVPPAADELRFATGMTVRVREPLTAYDLRYDDRDRVLAELSFDALEAPVPLRTGEPPYPTAHHFDQTGRVRGTVTLDGTRIAVDCYAMRDRSWGPRHERGYRRVGYTWLAAADTTLLTYTAPTGAGDEHIYSGYLRRGTEVSRLVAGTRRVERDPVHGWVTSIDVEAVAENGARIAGHARSESRLLLSIGNHVTVCSLLSWNVDGEQVTGEDQDVWPLHDWRALRASGSHRPVRA